MEIGLKENGKKAKKMVTVDFMEKTEDGYLVNGLMMNSNIFDFIIMLK